MPGRIRKALRAAIPGSSKRERQRIQRQIAKELKAGAYKPRAPELTRKARETARPPAPPPGRPPGYGAAPLPEPGNPTYDVDDDRWFGPNAPSRAAWERLQSRADNFLNHGGTFNRDVSGRDYVSEAGYQGLTKQQRSHFWREVPKDEKYKALINVLEQGTTPDELMEILNEQIAASTDYANGHVSRGKRLYNRIHDAGLPDELGYYHPWF